MCCFSSVHYGSLGNKKICFYMPCICSLIQKCSYLGNRKIIFKGQAGGTKKCVENVIKKIRVHRINGGEVKFKNMDKFEKNYRGQL